MEQSDWSNFLLPQTNSNMDCCDFSGNTPLHVAAGQGRSAMVSLLIAAGEMFTCIYMHVCAVDKHSKQSAVSKENKLSCDLNP